MNKLSAIQVHARQRAKERYDLNFGEYAREYFISAIMGNRSTLVERTSKMKSVRDVLYKGQTYRVVYHKKYHDIVTFLPITPTSHNDSE